MIAEAQLPEQIARSCELRLRSLMRSYGKVLVAYSGGVDSSYLALLATQELGKNAVCVIGISPSVSHEQRTEAWSIGNEFGFNLREIPTNETEDPKYQANPTNRCYYCKTELYSRLREVAAELQIEHIVDGTNSDDLNGHRPGRIAADENSVISPLAEVGLGKPAIRELSKAQGLTGWDKPSSPCLSSRIAYGVPVTIERLGQIERAEALLRDLGFREFRVRVHGDLARIEISKCEMKNALGDPTILERIANDIEGVGFKYVTLDLKGFRSGSLN
jgi:uncharacterized protein